MRAALAIAALIFAAPQPTAAQDRSAAVVVDEVDLRFARETAPVIGRLVAAVRSVVATRTAGVVAEVSVRAGSRLGAGDVIARLDDKRLRIEREIAAAAVAQARAELEAAEADVQLAEQALDRISRLRESSAFSESAFEDRRSELARAGSRVGAARARVASARASLDRVDYDLGHAAIRAPFAGVVLERLAQPGAYLQTGAPVAVLLDVGQLEIEADAPSEVAAALAPGIRAPARFSGGARAEAVLRAVVPEEAVSTRTRPVRFTVELPGPATGFAAGQSVTLDLPVGPAREVVTVSKDALVQGVRGWTVFVVEDGAAQPRQVRIGAQVGARVEVLDGLSPGDLAVVRGNERLRPGQPVAPETADAPPPARQG